MVNRGEVIERFQNLIKEHERLIKQDRELIELCTRLDDKDLDLMCQEIALNFSDREPSIVHRDQH